MPRGRDIALRTAAARQHLRVELLGTLAMSCGGRTLRQIGRKAQGLLGYLILCEMPEVTRERLVGLLWSESGEARARGSLRHAVLEVRTALDAAGAPPLKAERLTLGLDRSGLTVDLWEVCEQAKAGRVHPLLLERSRVTDAILAGLDGIDPAFDTWLADVRKSHHARLVAHLERALAPDANGPIGKTAETAAKALTRLDPAHEIAARVLIQARWTAGDIGTALRLYDELWRYLEEEFDAEPAPETQALIARLRLEQPPATALPTLQLPQQQALLGTPSPAVAARSGDAARPSIAVLPFQTLGPPDERYFGDGIVDDIIQGLAGLKELFVIAKGSTRNYRGATLDVKAIGRELGVRYILHGSVQRSGDQLRIHTMLADAETAEIVKPNRYSGRLSDLFDLQDQIALETTKLIAPYVRERELRRAMRKHPQNMTAYDLVLQALDAFYKLEYVGFARARELLQQAITLDPSYSLALSYAAHWHSWRIGQGWTRDPLKDSAEAARLAQLAIQQNPDDAIALAILGHVHSYVRRDFTEAMRVLDHAILVAPNSPLPRTLRSATLGYLGDGAGAVEEATLALRLSPLDARLYFVEHILSQAHYINGDFKDAAEWAARSDSRRPQHAPNLRVLAASLIALGRSDEARKVAERHASIEPGFRLTQWLGRTPLTGDIGRAIAEQLRAAGMKE